MSVGCCGYRLKNDVVDVYNIMRGRKTGSEHQMSTAFMMMNAYIANAEDHEIRGMSWLSGENETVSNGDIIQQGPVHVHVLRGVQAVSGGAALELLGPGEGHLLPPGLTGGQLTSERVAIVPASPVNEAGHLT